MNRNYLVPVIMALLLGACAAEPETEEKKETVFDDTTAAIDKAREVEATVNARVDALNEKLDEQDPDAVEDEDQ